MNFCRLLMFLMFSFLFSEEAVQEVEAVTAVKDVKKFKIVPPVGNNELTSLKGEPIKFDEMYKDGPMLLSFWFLGCAPCIAEMKYLSKFNEKYKDTGFKVISINTDTKSKGKIKSFVKKKKYSFDILFDVNGKNGVIKKLGGSACPFTALINMDGTIYSKHIGFERGDEIALEKEIIEFIDYNNELPIKIDSNINNGIPGWHTTLPQEEGYVYTMGTDTSRVMQVAVDKALLTAQSKFGNGIITGLETVDSYIQEETTESDETIYRAYVLLRMEETSENIDKK